MSSYSDSKGKSISLIKEIAKGGEGTVWQTNRSGYLAKTYHKPNQEQVEKLKLMIANPPQNPTAGQNHIAISWPTDLIKDNRGNWVGFLMREIKNAKELVCVYHPRNRKTHAPAFNWYCLHIIAYNLVLIIREIHAKNYVIGDINVKNILVNDRSFVSLIDTDSFQVTDPRTNTVYRCHVGSEGFTPPELIGKTLSQLTQTRYNDRFRLAVIIHCLLFGNHPFMGKWTGSGNQPGQNEAISQGHWPYGKNSSFKPSPNTIPLQILHPKLEQCFLKCFNDGHQSPTDRPSPDDWGHALQVAINDLVVCNTNKNHIYSKSLSSCCWCDRANALKVDIFPAVKNPIAPRKISVTPPSKPKQKKPDPAMLQLQSQNQALTQQLAQVNQQVSKLQSDNKSLNQQISKGHAQSSHHQQQSSALKKVAKVSKIIAIATTIAATALGGVSFLQYQERNQLIKQIEQIRQQNNLSPNGTYYSLESQWENFSNLLEGEPSLISGDLNELMDEMEKKAETSINELQQRISELESTNGQLEEQNNSLISRSNELEEKNKSLQSRINSLSASNNSLQKRIDQLEGKNEQPKNRLNDLEAQIIW